MALVLASAPLAAALYEFKSSVHVPHLLSLVPIYWLLLDLLQGAYALDGIPVQVVVTDIPPPYQVELFNAVAALGALELHVVYLHRVSRAHQSQEVPLRHSVICLDAEEQPFEATQASILGADLAVFNSYAAQPARKSVSTHSLQHGVERFINAAHDAVATWQGLRRSSCGL